jgi:hypothetical protein
MTGYEERREENAAARAEFWAMLEGHPFELIEVRYDDRPLAFTIRYVPEEESADPTFR